MCTFQPNGSASKEMCDFSSLKLLGSSSSSMGPFSQDVVEVWVGGRNCSFFFPDERR